MSLGEPLDERLLLVTDSGPIVISADTVREKAAQVTELERRAASAREELTHLIAYLRAVGRSDWVPPNIVVATATENVRAAGSPHGRVRAERGTWTSEILHILDHARLGATLEEIKQGLSETTLADRLRASANGFYNGVSTLEKRGDVVKYKGRVFATALFKEFQESVRRGEVEDLSGTERSVTVSDAAADVINQHPEGIKAGDIADAMVQAGTAPSAGSVYNVLSKLALRGRVTRSEGIYYPLKENGPPEGGPDTGGIAA